MQERNPDQPAERAASHAEELRVHAVSPRPGARSGGEPGRGRQPWKGRLWVAPSRFHSLLPRWREETGLPLRAAQDRHHGGENHDPAFVALNPNGKIPAIYDPDGPSGTPLALFESGAILLYLADKTRQFISADPNTRYETIQWVMWQMGGVGPMFGQVGFFNKFAGKAYEDKRPRDRYATESARLLGVLDARLAGREWVMGADYSIADISLLGWVRNLIGFYEARELVGFDRFLHVRAWLDRGLARPAVQRGINIPPRD
jgi:GST-like protein